MINLAELIEFVKEQHTFHLERAEEFSDNKYRKNRHLDTAEKFEHLSEYLETTSQKYNIQTKKLPLTIASAELEGLPDELVKELSISKSDEAEYAIYDITESNGGVISLDQLLIKYYRLLGEVVKRPAMTNRLHRMVEKGMIYRIPGRKGVYSLKDYTPEEAKELIGS